jgi:predicted transcriptional regulator
MATEFPVEAIFSEELLEELNDDFPEDLEALFELEKFTGFRTADGPEYTVVIADSESGTEIVVVTHTPERKLGGVIVNSDEDALRWAEERYVEIRAESERLDSCPE